MRSPIRGYISRNANVDGTDRRIEAMCLMVGWERHLRIYLQTRAADTGIEPCCIFSVVWSSPKNPFKTLLYWEVWKSAAYKKSEASYY